jgi:hypothetical protein
LILATTSTVIGFTFDVGPATIFAAFGGSIFGICFSRPTSPWLWGPLLVLAGTFACGWLMPDVLHWLEKIRYFPSLSEKATAFLLALAMIGGRGLIKPTAKTLYEAALKAVVTRIQSWGSKKSQEGNQ